MVLQIKLHDIHHVLISRGAGNNALHLAYHNQFPSGGEYAAEW